MKNILFYVIFLLFFISPLLSFGVSPQQQKETLLSTYSKQHPKEKAVFLKKKRIINIRVVDDEPQITICHYYKVLHLKPQSAELAPEQVSFSKFNEIQKIEAYTDVPQAKGGYKRYFVRDFQTRDTWSENVFYDDIKQKTFLYPRVAVGAITVLEYTEIIKEPRFLNAFYFSMNAPVEEASVKVIASSSVLLNVKLLNTNQLTVDSTQRRHFGRSVREWTVRHLPARVREDDAPAIGYHEPHFIPYLKTIKKSKKKIKKYLESPTDLYRWYYNLVKEAAFEEDSTCLALADSLTRHHTTDLEKARAIFYWVQENIRYIAFEDGLGGFVPRKPSDILKKRYGDCKDMACLTTALLKNIKIPAFLTWVGSRDIPYTYDQIPTPLTDNHMIASANIDGKTYFLDATGGFLPLEIPTAMIQGKQALIGRDALNFDIIQLPEINQKNNFLQDSCVLTILDDNLIRGTGKMKIGGYRKIDNFYELVGKNEKNKKEVIKNKISQANILKVFVDNLSFQGLNDRDKPLTMYYTFRLEDHSRKMGNEMFVNLHLSRPWQGTNIDTIKRVHDKENDYKCEDKQQIILNIPEGWRLDFLPESIQFENELFGFYVKYDYMPEKRQIVMQRNIYLNYLMLQKKDFSLWNTFIDSLHSAYRQNIVFSK